MERLCEKYALSTSFARQRLPLVEILPRIAEHGFRFLELWADRDHWDPRVQPEVKELRSLMDSLGLEAYSIHAPYRGLMLGHPRPELLKEWLKTVGESLEIGAEMGAQFAVVHPNSDLDSLTDDDCVRGRELSIAFVNELADR